MAAGLYEIEKRLLSKAEAQKSVSPLAQRSNKKLTLLRRWQDTEDSRLRDESKHCAMHGLKKNPSLCGTGRPNRGINVKSVSKPVMALR